MNNVSNMSISPLSQSIYVKPMEIHYTLNGIKKKWDFIELHDGVIVIIFNVTRKVLVCVKQFRPTVYIHCIPKEERTGQINLAKYPIELGITLEFCAGITDKTLSLEETAKAEILEETGYDVPIEKLEKVKSCWSNVSAAADKGHVYYAEVEDHMKVTKGGGLAEEGEFIEVVEISIAEAKKMYEDPMNVINGSVGFLHGLLWFLTKKASSFNLD